MGSPLSDPRAVLSAAREAVRLLDCLLGNALPEPLPGTVPFKSNVTIPVFDRLTLWLKLATRPAPPHLKPGALAAAQREAARLLCELMGGLTAVKVPPTGGITLFFNCGDGLVDRLMVWGAAVEDLEVLDEDDEDGVDQEPPTYASMPITTLQLGVPHDLAPVILDLYAAQAGPAPGEPDHLSAI